MVPSSATSLTHLESRDTLVSGLSVLTLSFQVPSQHTKRRFLLRVDFEAESLIWEGPRGTARICSHDTVERCWAWASGVLAVLTA
jgi:hypothetical protein